MLRGLGLSGAPLDSKEVESITMANDFISHAYVMGPP